MPATPRKIEVTAEDLQAMKNNGARDYDYNDIEVPDDYEATLVDVNDHKTANGESWKFSFEIMGCPFDEYASFSKKARWKLLQIAQALGFPVDEGINDFDPNVYIGAVAGAHVDWQTDPDELPEGAPNYREIKFLFPITEDIVNETEVVAEEEPAVI